MHLLSWQIFGYCWWYCIHSTWPPSNGSPSLSRFYQLAQVKSTKKIDVDLNFITHKNTDVHRLCKHLSVVFLVHSLLPKQSNTSQMRNLTQNKNRFRIHISVNMCLYMLSIFPLCQNIYELIEPPIYIYIFYCLFLLRAGIKQQKIRVWARIEKQRQEHFNLGIGKNC